MVDIDILRDEREHLRAELRELKNCQLRYFSFAIGATGAGLGLVSSGTIQNMLPLAFLAPLVIVLPCWWVFFDKATTITRIVGYYRVLEEMICQHPFLPPYPYMGFENAIAYYREKDTREMWREFRRHLKKRNPRLFLNKSNKNPLYTRHQYWNINFWTFALLGLVCISLSFVSCMSSHWFASFWCCCPCCNSLWDSSSGCCSACTYYNSSQWVFISLLALIGYGVVFVNTFRLLKSLKTGDFSYSVITEFWKYILKEEFCKHLLKDKCRF